MPDKPETDAIPPEILDRLAKFKVLVDRAAKSGQPLPAGGVFYLNSGTIWIAELHAAIFTLSRRLGIHPGGIKVNAKGPGDMEPTVGVDIPPGYAPQGLSAKDAGMVRSHVQGVIRVTMEAFKASCERRLLAWEVSK